ncbi:MAG: hypothetical protein IJ268_00660, partial [Proteobacteria bacterium]|nr:hypothetical protein [Pseudomonadota bacterium]
MILDNQMSSAMCVALKDAQNLAQQNRQEIIEIEHVLLSIFAQEGNVLNMFRSLGIDANYLIRRLERESENLPKSFKNSPAIPGTRLDQALQYGLDNALSNARHYCETTDFIAGVTRIPNGNAAIMLRSLNLTALSVQGTVMRLQLPSEPVNTSGSPFVTAYQMPAQNVQQPTAFGGPQPTAFGGPQPTAFGGPQP